MNNVDYKWKKRTEIKENSDLMAMLLILVFSFGYYISLCAKDWTWVFASYDSSDWLASSQIWMTPQPYGSPLFILLGHFINWLPHGGNLPLAITIGLSVLPASITIMVVYAIIRKLGYEQKYAMLGSMILLACGIFLSQATVLEEYALATMFVTIAFYFSIPIRKVRVKGEYQMFSYKVTRLEKRNKYLTMLFLALGTAIHIIIAPIAVLWIVINYKEVRKWLKPIILYIGICAVFYSVILVLMATDTPKLIAGNLSIQGINAYLGSTSTIGGISMYDSPMRLLQVGSLILLGFGICIIPFIKGLNKPWNNSISIMLITIIFCFWLYVTNKDMTTWTFTTFALPMVCVIVIIGLSKMPKWSSYLVIGWIFIALCLNSIFMSADLITKASSEPEAFYNSIEQLPNNSAVICSKGGAYGMATMYSYSNGKEIIPLFLQLEEGWNNRGYTDYLKWTEKEYGIEGDNWTEQIGYCLGNNIEVYIPYKVLTPDWQDTFDNEYKLEGYNEYFKKIKP